MNDRIRNILGSIRLSSVILILLGLVLLIRPDSGAKALTLTFGWLLVLIGGIGVGGALMAKLTFGYGAMGTSLTMLLVGILIVSRPMMLASLLGMILGAYLVFSGIGSFADARRLRINGRSSLFGLIWAVVSVAVGVYLMAAPMATSRIVMMVAGLAMIACGIGSIVTHARVQKLRQDLYRAQRSAMDGLDEDNIIDV